MIVTTLLETEQEIREAFPFDVLKLPLTGPDNAPTKHYGLFRDDTGECIGSAVRRGYEPHTTDDVAALTEAAATSFGSDCEISTSFNAAHQVVIGPSREHRISVFGTKDNIYPRFVLTAGYNGRSFDAKLGLYRDLCDNLEMVVPDGDAVTTCNLHHTQRLRSMMPDVVKQFQLLAGHWGSIADTVHRMEASEVDFADFVQKVYPLDPEATERQYKAAEKRLKQLVGRLFSERQRSGRPLGTVTTATAWEAYNVITGYVQHDKSRRGVTRNVWFSRAMQGLNDASCQRAMQLALAA